MAKILVQLAGASFTTDDLEWFKSAISGADGHSAETHELKIRNNQLTVVVDIKED